MLQEGLKPFSFVMRRGFGPLAFRQFLLHGVKQPGVHHGSGNLTCQGFEKTGLLFKIPFGFRSQTDDADGFFPALQRQRGKRPDAGFLAFFPGAA